MFLIYGSGSEEPRINQRIIDKQITNVKLKGRVPKKNIPFILSKSSLNLLNYSQEQYNWRRGNSSNKLFEYMTSGKPILSTVKMGYSIIQEYSCGMELESPTPLELAEAIMRFKKMPVSDYDKLSQNALKGSNDFDFKKLTNELERVISFVDHNI